MANATLTIGSELIKVERSSESGYFLLAFCDAEKPLKGIQLFSAEEKDCDIFFQWDKETGQKGWLKELDEIMKDTPRPKKK